VPAMPNPDGRVWHPFTVAEWARWWQSPMASQWLESDFGGLGVLILLHDEVAKQPTNLEFVKEIRLQRSCFGLTPLDRSRLGYEIARADAEVSKQDRRVETTRKRTGTHDPRHVLQAVK